MATEKEVSKILFVLQAAWPNMAEPTAQTVAVWHGALEDLPYETLNVAAKKVISEPRPFAPSAGEFRAVAFALMTPEVPPALEGWDLFKQSIREHNERESQTALENIARVNPLAARAAAALGWLDFWMSDVADEQSWRARFIECYNVYAKRAAENERDLPAVAEYRQVMQAAKDLTKRLASPVK